MNFIQKYVKEQIKKQAEEKTLYSLEYLDQLIQERLEDMGLTALDKALVEIKPKSMYLLILPTDIPKEQVEKHLAPFRDVANIVVLQADQVHLLEFSNGKS